jgi:hypothetical protein
MRRTAARTNIPGRNRGTLCAGAAFLFPDRTDKVGEYRRGKRANCVLDPNRRLDAVHARAFLKCHLVPLRELRIFFRAAIRIVISRNGFPSTIGRARQDENPGTDRKIPLLDSPDCGEHPACPPFLVRQKLKGWFPISRSCTCLSN